MKVNNKHFINKINNTSTIDDERREIEIVENNIFINNINDRINNNKSINNIFIIDTI
jgi:hypothetical protein